MTRFDELRLYHRAFVSRWEIPDDKRRSIINKMIQIVENDPDPKYQVQAARVLIAADGLNQKDEQAAGLAEIVRQQLLQYAAECGIDPGVIEGACQEAEGDAAGLLEQSPKPGRSRRT